MSFLILWVTWPVLQNITIKAKGDRNPFWLNKSSILTIFNLQCIHGLKNIVILFTCFGGECSTSISFLITVRR